MRSVEKKAMGRREPGGLSVDEPLSSSKYRSDPDLYCRPGKLSEGKHHYEDLYIAHELF